MTGKSRVPTTKNSGCYGINGAGEPNPYISGHISRISASRELGPWSIYEPIATRHCTENKTRSNNLCVHIHVRWKPRNLGGCPHEQLVEGNTIPIRNPLSQPPQLQKIDHVELLKYRSFVLSTRYSFREWHVKFHAVRLSNVIAGDSLDGSILTFMISSRLFRFSKHLV